MHAARFALASSAFILTAGFTAAPAQSSASQSIRVFAREVVVDINVTDAKGNPVHGLTRDDFTVLEDGRPIVPRSFREHRADLPTELPDPPALPANTFSNEGPAEGPRPLNLLLLDSLDTPIATQSIVQKRLTDFVDKVAPGTRLAVFSLSATGQLTLLQGFTGDRELLKKAIKSHKLDLQIPPLEDAGQEPEDTIPPPDASMLPKPKMQAGVPPKPQSQEPSVDQNVECNHAAVRGSYTLAAMSQITRYTSGMPGRKNLLWYTGAFPLRMRDKQGSVCYDFQNDLQAAESLLDHAHVAVFPVDSRAMDSMAKNHPLSRIVQVQAVEHLTMEAVAEGTGGKAIYNTNDLATAAAQAVDIGSNYYTVTYSPANQVADTRFRTIKVTVDKPDLTLLYMNGYHAMLPDMMLNGKQVENATPLQTAMMRGALQPTEVLFRVAVAVAAAPDSALPPGNTPDPKFMKPPFRHLTVSYTIGVDTLHFEPTPENTYRAQFEYAVSVFDANNGKLVNSSVMAAKPNLPDSVYRSMLSGGAKLRQEIDLPARGDYILRVGVRDLANDHVGAIELPASAVR